MIRIIYAFSLILSFAPNVIAAGKIDFSFNCKILDQQILEVEDGESSRYGGYIDGSKIGDTFKLNFEYTEFYGDAYRLNIIVTDHKEVKLGSVLTDENFTKLNDTYEYVTWNYFGRYKHTIGKNSILIAGGDRHITGKRYYKNDWNLILKAGLYERIFIQTANCMNVPDKLGIIFDKIKENHK